MESLIDGKASVPFDCHHLSVRVSIYDDRVDDAVMGSNGLAKACERGSACGSAIASRSQSHIYGVLRDDRISSNILIYTGIFPVQLYFADRKRDVLAGLSHKYPPTIEGPEQ